jgi:hypothetical protein
MSSRCFPTVALLIVWVTFGCLIARADSSDEIFAQRLLGTWQGEGIEKTFNNDGTATGFVYLPEDPENTRTSFKSSWRVENGYLIGKVLESSNSKALPPGDQFSDKIISVTENEFVFENQDGERQVRTRKKPLVIAPESPR